MARLFWCVCDKKSGNVRVRHNSTAGRLAVYRRRRDARHFRKLLSPFEREQTRIDKVRIVEAVVGVR